MTTQRWKHIRQMKERRMDGWMDGWLDEWVGGWTDGWKHAERLELTIEPMSKWLHTATQAKQVAATIRKKHRKTSQCEGDSTKRSTCSEAATTTNSGSIEMIGNAAAWKGERNPPRMRPQIGATHRNGQKRSKEFDRSWVRDLDSTKKQGGNRGGSSFLVDYPNMTHRS